MSGHERLQNPVICPVFFHIPESRGYPGDKRFMFFVKIEKSLDSDQRRRNHVNIIHMLMADNVKAGHGVNEGDINPVVFKNAEQGLQVIRNFNPAAGNIGLQNFPSPDKTDPVRLQTFPS